MFKLLAAFAAAPALVSAFGGTDIEGKCLPSIKTYFSQQMSKESATDIKNIRKHFTEDVEAIWQQEPKANIVNGVMALKRVHEEWFQLFPDLAPQAGQQLTHLPDGRVMAEMSMAGTSTITGRKVSPVNCVGLFDCDETKISKMEWFCDFTGMLKAGGAL